MDEYNTIDNDNNNSIYNAYLMPENYYSIRNYSKKRKKTRKKRSFFNFFMIIIAFLLVLSIANILCFALYSSGFSLITKEKQNVSSYYFLQVGNYSSYTDAQKLANEVNIKGGAGYIFFDGGYRILLSAYQTKNDAEKVANNIINSYPNVQTFHIDIMPKIATKKLNKKQQSSCNVVIAETTKSINNLFELFVDFDQNKKDIQKIKNLVSIQKTKLENALTQYDNNVIGESITKLYKFRSEMSNITKYLDNIITSSTMGNEFSSLIKYQHISSILTLKKAINYIK